MASKIYFLVGRYLWNSEPIYDIYSNRGLNGVENIIIDDNELTFPDITESLIRSEYIFDPTIKLIKKLSDYKNGLMTLDQQHKLGMELRKKYNFYPNDESIDPNLIDIYVKIPSGILKGGKIYKKNKLTNEMGSDSQIDYRSEKSNIKLEDILKSYILNASVNNVKINPYKYFNGNVEIESGKNCLVELLKNKYGYESDAKLNDRKNGISNRIIEKYFNKERTISKLIEFSEKRKIPMILYNVSQRKIYENNPEKTKYKKLVCMIYDNHIYEYTKQCSKNIDFSVDKVINENIRFPNILNGDDKRVRDFCEQFSDNYFYKSEHSILVCALLYNDKTANIDEYEYGCIDMNKAYYNSLMDTTDDNRIPVFTCSDMIKKYEGDRIEDCGIYFMSIKGMDKLKMNDITKGYVTNIMHGMEIKFMLREKIIDESDIEYSKIPTYFGRVRDVKRMLNKIATHDAEKIDDLVEQDKEMNRGLDDIKARYTILYNGLLGRRMTRELNIIYENLKDIDIELLKLTNGIDNYSEETGVGKKVTKTSKYMYLNNRNIYNYVISLTNLKMMRLIKRLKKDGMCISRISVDSVTFYDPETKRELESVDESFLLFNDNEKIEIEKKYLNNEGVYIREKEQYEIPKRINEYMDELLKRQVCKNSDGQLIFKKERVKEGRNEYKYKYIDGKRMHDETIEEIKEISKNIYHIFGAPGTGKTYTIKNDKEYDFDIGMTWTNLCLNNMRDENHKYITLSKGFKLFKCENSKYGNIYESMKQMRNKSIWIDEYSFLQRKIYNYINILSKVAKRIILSGDINQVGAQESNTLLKDVKLDFSNEYFQIIFGVKREKNILRIVDTDRQDNGKIKEMTIDYRNTERLRRFRDHILDGEYRSLIGEAKKYNNQLKKSDNREIKKIEEIDTHLVFRNKYRMYINEEMLSKKKLKFKVSRKISGNTTSYKVEISPGVILRSYYNIKLNMVKTINGKEQRVESKIYKNSRYYVHSITNNESLVWLLCLDNYSGDKYESVRSECIGIKKSDMKYFTLGWGITVHSAQGLTLHEDGYIHEIGIMLDETRYGDKSIYYTAITRFKDVLNIYFNAETLNKVEMNEYEKKFEEKNGFNIEMRNEFIYYNKDIEYMDSAFKI